MIINERKQHEFDEKQQNVCLSGFDKCCEQKQKNRVK